MIYDIGFLIFSIFYLPTLIFKGKVHRDFLERFGMYDKNKRERLSSAKNAIWIQAVSVGEVAVCKSLIPLLKEKLSGHTIVLSTITKTGNDLAKRLFSGDAIIIYFPLDLSFIVKKVVGLIRPEIYIMVETEIWPNLLNEISRLRIPSILINGRISDRSFGKYRLTKPFLKKILKRINSFCMQSELDAKRIISLGAHEGKVEITGNMKFDVELEIDADGILKMRDSIGLKDTEDLFVCGSTHGREEEILMAVYRELIKEFPRLKLLIAPRHIERVAEIEKVILGNRFTPVRVSGLGDRESKKNEPRTTNHDSRFTILILDTIGQLKYAYSIATLVFVGGSLVKHGGQNPIEPAVFEKPILFGPHMFNFRDAASILLRNNAAIQISGRTDLLREASSLLRDEAKRCELGENAREVILKNRGSTEENLKTILEIDR